MDKLNIIFVAPLPPPYGGIANWTKLVTKYLEKENLADVSIVNTAPKGRVTEGRSLFERIFISGFAMLGIVSKLKAEIKSSKPDCAHLTTSGSLSVIRDLMVAKLLFKKKIRFVYHIHFGRIPDIYKNNTLEWKIIKRIIKLSDHTIAIDTQTKNTLMALFGDKIVYIPNPIDIRLMPKLAEKPENTVVYLGWVIKQKGIEELVASWGDLLNEVRGWKLQIVGPYKEEYLIKLKNKYKFDGIEVLGEKSHKEAMELLNKASIFVLPSYSEGCPYVIIEAMALKKIVIGTKVGNIPEMLSDDCGILVKPKDKNAIKEKIYEVIIHRNQLQYMGELAYNRIMEEYNIDIVCKKMLSLLK